MVVTVVTVAAAVVAVAAVVFCCCCAQYCKQEVVVFRKSVEVKDEIVEEPHTTCLKHDSGVAGLLLSPLFVALYAYS